MNPLSGLRVVAGDMDSFDFHQIEQPRTIRELSDIAGRPNCRFWISSIHGESQLSENHIPVAFNPTLPFVLFLAEWPQSQSWKSNFDPHEQISAFGQTGGTIMAEYAAGFVSMESRLEFRLWKRIRR